MKPDFRSPFNGRFCCEVKECNKRFTCDLQKMRDTWNSGWVSHKYFGPYDKGCEHYRGVDTKIMEELDRVQEQSNGS